MKKITLSVIAVLIFATGYSQSKLWTQTSEMRIGSLEKVDRASTPTEYQLFSLDFAGLKNLLKTAPSRENATSSSLIIPFPDANGKMQRYYIYESSVMEPELAAKNPEIQSYVGKGIDDPTASIHLTTTIFGLHTMTLSVNGTFYIDPYTKDLNNYVVYNKKNVVTKNRMTCLFSEEDTELAGKPAPQFGNQILASDGKFRTYRLAMACTIEYAAEHITAAGAQNGTVEQKKDVVLAAMNVTVARVNSVYERDMSLRMVLVGTNKSIIFVDSDNFENDNAEILIGQSQSTISALIGSNNYDIGHTVSTGGGGLAGLGVVCNANTKASGITGSPSPVGDPFDIDYVAHEIGHQFGANHTFAGTGGSCGVPADGTSNASAASAMEPGSGSTIMAYAGICSNNIQRNSDAYFHYRSIQQMVTVVNNACVAGVVNGNTPPVIAPIATYVIPKGTPFSLTGSATDANGDTLTYCWEQTNAAIQNPLPTGTNSGPNFRSFPPTASPKRHFPSLETLASGGSPYEVLPTGLKSMSFALTVRDNRSPNGGQTSTLSTNVTTNTATGPFIVTSQNAEGISWLPGSQQTITWNVAGTSGAPINTANVKISLSTDGGQSYGTVLVASTPNNGSYTFNVPAVNAPFCRIMIEAIGGIYFAVNTTTFAIGFSVVTTCNTYSNNTPLAIPESGSYATTGINVPAGVNMSYVKVGINATHPYIMDMDIAVLSPSGTQVSIWGNECGSQDNLNATFSDAGSAISCASPTVGTIKPTEALSAIAPGSGSGVWTLGVRDLYQGDSGTLNSWNVQICSQVITPLSNETFGLQEFKIHPNPNNGFFNVEFNSNSNSDITVGVYDLRGRLIMNKTYANTGRFSENLQLQNVQSGIYLVTVQDGNTKETKKIIVE